MAEKKRVLYYDVLNIAACLAVISLHHNGIVHTFSDSIAWKTALIVEVGAYWAVPIFLMLTGATLMNYREKYDTPTFFRKRFTRAFIPFAVWSVIVLVWKLTTGQFAFKAAGLREILSTLLNNEMESVYWYFPFLFSVYLTLPLLSWLTEPKHRSTLRYAILVIFVLQSVLQPLAQLAGLRMNGNYGLPINAYLIFVLLGYYLSTAELTAKVRRRLYWAGLAGAIFRYAAVLHLSLEAGKKHTLFFNYGRFPSVMLAVAVFVWAKQVNWERVFERLHVRQNWVSGLASCSLGVYLIHKIVMYYELDFLSGFGITTTRLVWRILCIPVTYLIAVGIVTLIKRVPGLRKLVP